MKKFNYLLRHTKLVLIMPTKSYINPENKLVTISEPAVAYETAGSEFER